MAAMAMLQRPQRSRGDLLPAGSCSFLLAIAAWIDEVRLIDNVLL